MGTAIASFNNHNALDETHALMRCLSFDSKDNISNLFGCLIKTNNKSFLSLNLFVYFDLLHGNALNPLKVVFRDNKKTYDLYNRS